MAPGGSGDSSSKKITAGICGIMLGGFGVHKFILGYTSEGIIMLVSTMAGWFLGAFLIFPFFVSATMGLIGLIEGVTYLTKTDEEFANLYLRNKRSWF